MQTNDWILDGDRETQVKRLQEIIICIITGIATASVSNFGVLQKGRKYESKLYSKLFLKKIENLVTANVTFLIKIKKK